MALEISLNTEKSPGKTSVAESKIIVMMIKITMMMKVVIVIE